MLVTELAQAGGAYFLSRLDQKLHVEAEPCAVAAPLGNHGSKRSNVDAVLPLVVGSAAAIEAIAFHGEPPRRETRAPHIVLAAHRVAVPIDQDGGEPRILRAVRNQDRRTLRIVKDAAGKSDRSERRLQLLVEIAPQLGGAFRFLAAARNGNPAAQIGKERTTVEIGVRAGDRCGATHDALPARD